MIPFVDILLRIFFLFGVALALYVIVMAAVTIIGVVIYGLFKMVGIE